ncbi:MAG: hypothetical protein Q8S73_06125 [Deltaproteobacteria bacterium]|nr:hypothetical protein [Myxococcales bacterium]MDP3213660.1 hypothetical protein [Deltaproteobacteria bacterium]
MIVLRCLVAILGALALADCGGMHACTADGLPCEEASRQPLRTASSGGARPAAPLFPAATVAANAPFVAPAFDPPPAAPAPEPVPEAPAAPPPTPTATVTDTTVAAAAVAEDEDEGSGRRHGRHRRHSRHSRSGGRHHGSSSSGSHSRHRRHR